MEFGSQIKYQRQKLGLSQGQMAYHLYISPKTVSHWENGDSYPDISTLIKISDYFRIPLGPLIKEDKNMEENLKKREVKRDVGLPFYISMFLSLMMFFVTIAGGAHVVSFSVTIFAIFILTTLNVLVWIPINNLRQKRGLTSNLERKFMSNSLNFYGLGIVIIFLGILSYLKWNELIGSAVIGGGIGLIVWILISNILDLVFKKKVYLKK